MGDELNPVLLDRCIRHCAGSGNANHRRWAAERARDLLDSELARLEHLRLIRLHTRLRKLRPTEQDTRTMRTP